MGRHAPTCDAGLYVDLTGRLTVRGRLTAQYLGEQTYLTIRKPVERAFPGYTARWARFSSSANDRV